MDDLSSYVADREGREPGFANKVKAAEVRAHKRAELGKLLRECRGKMSQTVIAARMGTSASIVRRVEAGDDVRLSTLEKYAEAVGVALEIKLG